MANKYQVVTEVNEQKWQKFVFNHPYGNIFQTPAMFAVYKKTKNYLPIKLFLIDEKENICGLVSAVIMKEKGGLIGRLSARAIIQGGPLFENKISRRNINKLLDAFDKLVQSKAIYAEVRSINENFLMIKKSLAYYKFEDHLNFLISLKRNEKEVFGQIHKSTKKKIKRALKKGLMMEEITNKKQIFSCYKLIKSTYTRVKIPLSDQSLFEAAFQILTPDKLAKFFSVKYKNRLIGTRIILTYKDILYDWYAGASRDYLDCYPNEFLVWSILKWGIKEKYKVFDFGGAGKPNVYYGPREFKRRFGGQLVNYGRNIKVYKSAQYYFLNFGLKIYQLFLSKILK